MHGGVGHGAQVDPEAELVVGEILGQRHVGPPIGSGFEVTGQFLPHVAATDAFIVHAVGHAVDCNSNFSYVGVEVVFRIPISRCVWADEQKQNALERPALGVHPKVKAGVRTSCDGHHPFAHDEVVRELLATSIGAGRLIGQSLASNDLILHLDVLQLVPEHVRTSLALHDLGCGGEGKLENQVVVKGLWVENSVVGEDGVVQIDAILSSIYCIQSVFLIHAASLLIA